MNKLGHLFMCPKVDEDLGEMKEVEPTRILEDEFKGAQRGDNTNPYTAGFVMRENKIYMVAFNKER